MANRRLPRGFMAYTTERRFARLKRTAAILQAAGVDLESTGHTGVLNDLFENELEDYLRRRLEAAGKSKAVISAMLTQFREE